MKQISTLGKIIFLLFIPFFLHGEVTATLDKVAIYKGDVVTLKITARGEDIEFPSITNIQGFDVLGRSSSSEIHVINSKITKSKSISYTFVPTKTISIPSYKLKINGIDEYTPSLNIKVIKPKVGKVGDDFIFSLEVSKNKVYAGEAIYAQFKFLHKVGVQIVDINLDKLSLEHFWIKDLNNPQAKEKNGYIEQTINYILFPQIEGNQTIPSQQIRIAVRENRTNFIKWVKVLSNEKNIEVKSLPNNLNVQGDYTISASVDKLSVKTNEPVNLSINIKGTGNIDDIEAFNIDFEDQVVYASKPEIKNSMINNNYGGEFSQKISIIGDKNFTIDPIELKYFDIKQQKIITIRTKSFDIEVKNAKEISPSIQTKQNTSQNIVQLPPKIIIQKENELLKYIFLITGIILGILVAYVFNKSKIIKKDELEISKKIKKAKNDKALYEILLPYSTDMNLKIYMLKLEENIYNNGKNKIDKKTIIEIFEEELEQQL